MSLPTLSALRENRKRRRDQQCGSEDEPAGVAPRNTTASPASSQQNSVVNHSPTLWSQSYLDELLHPVFGLDPLNAAQLGTPNHDIGSNGLDNRTPWQGSPAAMYANFGSRRSIPNCEPAVRVSPNQPENPDIGGDRAGTAPTISSGLSNRSIGMHSTPGTAPNEIPLSAAASFFRTYFSVIHPQYPFLDIKICSGYYTTWKSRQRVELAGWPAFFVNMIFAVGSLIEAKNDSSPYFQYQHLKSRAQSEQSIMTDSTSTPLIRLQAMLLSAMFALHAENTWRIAHISGVLMKFASLNGFNRLDKHAEDPDYLMSVRVWSCVYSLDRAVSSALGTPVSLPDLYISSPLFEVTLDTKHDLPWLADCDWGETKMYPDLQTFAHVCKIRAIQSFFMHMVEKDGLHTVMIPPELELHMQKSLRDWMDPAVLAKHSVENGDGYRSPLWLQHIGHLTTLSVCSVYRSNAFSAIANNAIRAACDACSSFRSLQRKRQVAQPWLVVISQFRAAVTLWYIIWARAIHVPREVSDALRDCSATLAIFAERWPKAENYRDCFELLATSVPRCQPLGYLAPDVGQELSRSIRKLEESGIHRTTSRMLWDMCKGNDGPSQPVARDRIAIREDSPLY